MYIMDAFGITNFFAFSESRTRNACAGVRVSRDYKTPSIPEEIFDNLSRRLMLDMYIDKMYVDICVYDIGIVVNFNFDCVAKSRGNFNSF